MDILPTIELLWVYGAMTQPISPLLELAMYVDLPDGAPSHHRQWVMVPQNNNHSLEGLLENFQPPILGFIHTYITKQVEVIPLARAAQDVLKDCFVVLFV